MVIMVIIILDLLVMGITSAVVTNRIKDIQKDLKDAGKEDTVTYQAYGIVQNTIDVTLWITWSTFGIALLSLIGYILLQVLGKSGGGEGGGEGEGGGGGEGEKEDNNPLFTLLFIVVAACLFVSTGFSIYTLMLISWTNKISTYEGTNDIIGDKNGYYMTWITVIAGLVIAIPIFLWGIYEFYKATK